MRRPPSSARTNSSDEIAVIDTPGRRGACAAAQTLRDYGDHYPARIAERVTGKIAPTKIDWPEKLDKAFGPLRKGQRRRESAKEKASALDVLANSRLSVLIGPAGTGKTTVLRQLLEQKKIVGSGVGFSRLPEKHGSVSGSRPGRRETPRRLRSF